jgi:hypothetical protein
MDPPSNDPRRGRADEPLAAKLLVDDEAREVLGAFLGRSRSAQEAASDLGRDLDSVLYRVKRLLQAGLLVVVEERSRGGRAIKIYRSPFERWFVPFEALPYADVEETLMALHVVQAQRVARAAARHLVRTPWAGFLVERGSDGRVWMVGASRAGADVPAEVPFGEGVAGVATDATVELHLTPEEALALNRELHELVHRYVAVSAGRETSANRLLNVSSVPLDAD